MWNRWERPPIIGVPVLSMDHARWHVGAEHTGLPCHLKERKLALGSRRWFFTALWAPTLRTIAAAVVKTDSFSRHWADISIILFPKGPRLRLPSVWFRQSSSHTSESAHSSNCAGRSGRPPFYCEVHCPVQGFLSNGLLTLNLTLILAGEEALGWFGQPCYTIDETGWELIMLSFAAWSSLAPLLLSPFL